MTSEPARPSRSWRVLRYLVLAPLCLVCAWSLLGPPSPEALVFSLAVFGLTFGAATGRRRWVAAGVALALAVVGFRLTAADRGRTIENGQSGGPARLLDRVVPERDLALGASRFFLAVGAMPGDEPGLLDHLDDGYDRMRAQESAVPSPVLGSVLFGQSPIDHGVLRVVPARVRPDSALVFLHGYGGSVTLLCWQVAQAVAPLGMETVCPATRWQTRWASPEGRAIVAETLQNLRARGVQRIYLAGLSAGAIGASRLAPDVHIDGLVLISGVSRRARPTRVPTLVLHGARDPMTPVEPARRYAAGASVRYLEVADAGHWLVLSHHERVRSAIETFLRERGETSD